MRVLLLGQQGQVGWELQRSLSPLGECLGLDRRSTQGCGDLTRLEALVETVKQRRPDVVVNAAAYTAVDNAESDETTARLVNAQAPAALARTCAEMGIWLVHYSTDYVFDGSGDAPWSEDDATGPLNVYGQTKLEGEQAIAASGCPYLIFRTSWVYAARGGNFAKTMLRLARERETLSVVSDQHGAPTGADLIADVTAHAIRVALHRPELGGLYHLTASGETTWHGYASHVIETARSLQPGGNWTVQSIASVDTAAFPTPAKRPLNSRLNTQRLRNVFGLCLPDWRTGVNRMIREITS